MVHLSGTWARERTSPSGPLRAGPRSRSRARAGRPAPSTTRSSRSAGRRPTRPHGEAIGFSLVYSGNFLAEVEVEPFGTARARLGIEPETFAWRLEPGDEFTTPEALVGWIGDRAGRPQPRLPRPVSAQRLARGAMARPTAADPAQQLGGHVLRLRRRTPRRDGRRRQGPGDRAVRARRRLVRPSRRGRQLAR